MENATKALLIAGSILLTILILSVFVALYTNLSNQSNVYKNAWSSTEISRINSTFEAFIGRNNIKAQEIVTLYNKINKYKEQGINIELSVPGKTDLNSSPIEFLKKHMNTSYRCSSVQYDNNNLFVKSITFN